MSDTLFTEPQRDQFQHESPIRAFTDWSTQGHYAIGKGFRPSVQHLVSYLDAMERKENWQVVQVLDAGNGLTILFRQAGLKIMPEPCGESSGEPIPYDADKRARFVYDNEPNNLIPLPDLAPHVGLMREMAEETARVTGITEAQTVKIVIQDDPVNPKHYAGRACADIGEHLTANSYQVLKYCWRLGKKDDALVELGKALWYLNSERSNILVRPEPRALWPMGGKAKWFGFCAERTAGQSALVQNLVNALSRWSFAADSSYLRIANDAIEAERDRLTKPDCGSGLAV